MTVPSRVLSIAAVSLAAAVLFVVGAVAAGAENPPSTSPTDAGATTVAADPTTAAVPPTTTAADPTTTAAAATTAPAPTTTAAAATTTTPTAATAPAPPATTTTATPSDPWAAFLAWLAALQARRRQQQQQQSSAPAVGTSSSSSSSSSTSSSSTSASPSNGASGSSSSSAATAAPTIAPAVSQPAPAHLTVAGSATPDAITVGSTVTYTFTVTNSGGRATTAAFTDTLPADVNPVAADVDQGSCSGSQSVTCALGSIAPGQTVTVTVVVQVNRAATFQNTISLTAGDPSAKVDSAGGPLRLQAGAGSAIELAVPGAKARTAATRAAAARKAAAAKRKAAAAKRKAAAKAKTARG